MSFRQQAIFKRVIGFSRQVSQIRGAGGISITPTLPFIPPHQGRGESGGRALIPAVLLYSDLKYPATILISRHILVYNLKIQPCSTSLYFLFQRNKKNSHKSFLEMTELD